MEKVQCLNCKKLITLKEIKKGINAACKCGCNQICLNKHGDISNWRVTNPFDFEDRRNV